MIDPKVLGFVAAGGAVGAACRYMTIVGAARLLGTALPWGTLFVNVFGSFVMGVVVTVLAARYALPQHWQAFLMAGVLGGYTTFSAFSLDVLTLTERGAWMPAFGYVLGSVVLALAGIVAGASLVRSVLS